MKENLRNAFQNRIGAFLLRSLKGQSVHLMGGDGTPFSLESASIITGTARLHGSNGEREVPASTVILLDELA